MTRLSQRAEMDPYRLAEVLGRPRPTEQQAALIAAPLMPTLVVAGAGAGKTETIAQRVVYLVANGLAEPGQILGLTFTRKAAGELSGRIRSRLRTLAGSGLGDPIALQRAEQTEPMVSTYHAFAGQVIDEFGPLIAIEPAVRVLTPTAAWQLVHDLVRRWDRDLDVDRGSEQVAQDVLDLSSALADHLVTVDQLDAELSRILTDLTSAPPSGRQRGSVHSALASVIKQLTDRRAVIPLVGAYAVAKRQLRVVDFADHMQLAAAIVRDSEHAGQILRDRYRIVLLDEYQDTGHAQRVILRGLFGDPGPDVPFEFRWRGHPVMAVGDPVQSIYAWRGASASNLPRFGTDFPAADGTPAPTRELLISFRNDRRILDVANAVSDPVRKAPVLVGVLEPVEEASPGSVTAAVCETVLDENAWLAAAVASRWFAAPTPPTMAILVRRRSSMAAIAAALRDRDVPVDVVGVGGLIDEPEVADIVAMLRVVVDHRSGPAAIRILTGARWRLGIADVAALSRRAGALSPGRGAQSAASGAGDVPIARIRAALAEAVRGDDVDEAGLVDAIADPGEAHAYSAAGWRRIAQLAAELRYLRTQLATSLRDLVMAIERALMLDVEVLTRPDGRVHLDAFADLVASLESEGAGPVELLDYLTAAADREDGLAAGEVEVSEGRVQVMTIHAAKGLEWDVVAVPQLSVGTFPSDLNSTWLGDATQIPPGLRGDRDDVPRLRFPDGADQGRLAEEVKGHRAEWAAVHRTEERRLFYVAVTRARHELLLSSHYWSATRKEPTGPGEFLAELVDLTEASPGRLLGEPETVAPPPLLGANNPLLDVPETALWPIDPLQGRREGVDGAAREVSRAMAAAQHASSGAAPPMSGSPEADDPEGWLADAAVLLAERAQARSPAPGADVPLPRAISVSTLVEMAADPQRLARRLRRPVPLPPAPRARRGTAFHAWLEHFFGGEPLLDLNQLPGAHDLDAVDDERLPQLIAAFRASPWAARTPVAIEVPFVTRIAGLPIRGRIDAVFAEPDGGALVVDWKTGAIPRPDEARAIAVQLTAYRLAWSRLAQLPRERVRAVFYYVAHDRVVAPEELMDADGLAQLINDSVEGQRAPSA